jgi:hypothetical protein
VDVGEVLQLLDEREAACRAEADRLEAEAERIGALLASCRRELERLVAAREVVGELTVGYPAAAVMPEAVAGVASAGGDVEAFAKQVLAVLAERGRPVRVLPRTQKTVAVAYAFSIRPRYTRSGRNGGLVTTRPSTTVDVGLVLG